MNDAPQNPHAAESSGEKRKLSAPLRLWAGFQATLWAVAPAIILLIMIILVIREIHQNTIEVVPIQVPTSLAETGLTPEVLALPLLDQIAAAERVVTSERVVRPHVELDGQKPDFNVPIAGISLGTLADIARNSG